MLHLPDFQFISIAADIPLKKAVAGVRVGLLPELGFVVNPTVQQMEESKLDLIMAGTDSAVLMIEGYCDFLTEDQMLEVSFPATSHAVPWMSLLSQGHLLLPRNIFCCPRDICCFPGTSAASQGRMACHGQCACKTSGFSKVEFVSDG